MNAFLRKYLESEGFKSKLSKTTQSEYYINKDGVTVRFSDHRGSFAFDINILKVQNKKSEYLLYVGLGRQPIVLEGLKEVKDAIKWYSLFKYQFDKKAEAKVAATTLISSPDTKKAKKTLSNTLESSNFPKGKSIQTLNTLDDRWVKFKPKQLKEKMYCIGVHQGTYLMSQERAFREDGVWLSRLFCAIRGTSGVKISNFIEDSTVRDYFGKFFILDFEGDFYSLMGFLIFLQKYKVSSINKLNELYRTFKDKTVISLPEPPKPINYIKDIKPGDVIDVNKKQIPLPIDDPRVTLMNDPNKNSPSWISRMELYLMKDIKYYSTFRRNTRDFIKESIQSGKYEYYSFIQAIMESKTTGYSLETVKKNIEKL